VREEEQALSPVLVGDIEPVLAPPLRVFWRTLNGLVLHRETSNRPSNHDQFLAVDWR
jgi:hypothetical protein